MIRVQGLTKRYGATLAVEDISFSVAEGEIVGFLGPNGAGKSTVMNIITGYLSSSEGSVAVGGYDILEQPKKAKALMGYLPEHPPLYLDMTVREYLGFICGLKRLRLGRQDHIEEVCELVGVDDVLERRLGNLSKGYRQRVGIAQALLGNPPALILDEPTVGLDPRQIIDIRGLISELGKKHTVILSSHILHEVQAVCRRVVVIDRGHIIADGAPGALARELAPARRIIARIDGPREAVGKLLSGISGVESAEELGPAEGAFEWALTQKEGADARRPLFYALAKKGWPLLSLRGGEAGLEEIFLSLTAREQIPAAEDIPKTGEQCQDEGGPKE